MGWTRPVGNSGQRFVPWAGVTPSTPHEGDVAHVQAVEARNAQVGSPRSTEDMMESEVPHSDDHSVTSDEESVAGEPSDRVPDEEVPIVLPHLRDAVIRAAIRSMDEVNPRALFEKRAAVMKAVPRFLRGQECIEVGIGGGHQEP